MFYIGAAEALSGRSVYHAHKWHFCIALLICGTILWPIGLTLNARARKKINARESTPPPEPGEEQEKPEVFLLFNLAYWGPMLVAFSIILVFVSPRAPIFAQ